jgi:hypothetical protein
MLPWACSDRLTGNFRASGPSMAKPSGVHIPATKELRQSLEKLQIVADIISALEGRMAELLELREAVRKAEAAAARSKAKVASIRKRGFDAPD